MIGSIAVFTVGVLIFDLHTQVAPLLLALFSQQGPLPFETDKLVALAMADVTAVPRHSYDLPPWAPLVTRVISMALIGLPVWYLVQRREREEELQRLDEGWEVRLQSRTEELMAVNNALVSEVSKRIDTEQSLEAHRRDLRLLAAQLLRLQEEERRRISRDLHDDINQRLALLSIDIEVLEQELSSGPIGAVRTVRAIQDRIVELSDNVRHLAHQLHPSILDDLGLSVALRRLVDDFRARTGIKTAFIHKDIPKHLDQEVLTCFYRVAQESLANVSRHAKAKNVHIELRQLRYGLQLMVSDDGTGFDVNQCCSERGGLGLLSMKERVSLVEGTLDIQSRKGEGTSVCAWVPLTQKCV
ncbi:MAG: sensor histidine kinase [Nitrospiraceae bacterium]